ncbi:MAG TPA: ABC transporter ATP-binding protein [Elusimicrobiota bacterium]|nr:ABC transporter ATP-binding protein [Elusimicrobiota bacterium]
MLTIRHLSVDYFRRGETVHAVRDVSLSVDDGEAVGLVGESGSGKSTVALAAMRLIRPNEGRIKSGEVAFGGQENLLAIPESDMRKLRGRRIAMIFQDPFTALNPVLRIREQMAEVFWAHPDASAPREIDDRLREALSTVQLDSGRILDAYPHQLSGGQRQRVLIATALLCRPDLLLADEPTTALDVLVQKEILDLLFSLQKQLRTGLLFISHNLALVAHYTHRVAVMKEGGIVETGTAAELFKAAKHPYTRMLLAAVPRWRHSS